MTDMTVWLRRLALGFGLAAVAALAQEPPPPEGPFQAIHVIRVDTQKTDAEKTLLKAISAMNQAIVKAGCRECIYHLWKGSIEQPGGGIYLQISAWPGRAVYDRIHNSAEYAEASKSWSELRSVVKEEFYNRYVEIK
jgi:hypothetical protein